MQGQCNTSRLVTFSVKEHCYCRYIELLLKKELKKLHSNSCVKIYCVFVAPQLTAFYFLWLLSYGILCQTFHCCSWLICLWNSGANESQFDGRFYGSENVAEHSTTSAVYAGSWRSGVCCVQRSLDMSAVQGHALRLPRLSCRSVHTFPSLAYCLARSAKLPNGLYIFDFVSQLNALQFFSHVPGLPLVHWEVSEGLGDNLQDD